MDMLRQIGKKLSDKAVEQGKEKIKNGELKDNFIKLTNLIIETKEIIDKKESFDQEDFRHWKGCSALTELDLNKLFMDLMTENCQKEGDL